MTYPSTNLFIAAPGNQILLSSRVVCLFSGEAEAADDEEITDFLYDYASRFSEKFCLTFRRFPRVPWNTRGQKWCFAHHERCGGAESR